MFAGFDERGERGDGSRRLELARQDGFRIGRGELGLPFFEVGKTAVGLGNPLVKKCARLVPAVWEILSKAEGEDMKPKAPGIRAVGCGAGYPCQKNLPTSLENFLGKGGFRRGCGRHNGSAWHADARGSKKEIGKMLCPVWLKSEGRRRVRPRVRLVETIHRPSDTTAANFPNHPARARGGALFVWRNPERVSKAGREA